MNDDPYAPPPPDTAHVMESLASLHAKVDAMALVLGQLLRALAGERPA